MPIVDPEKILPKLEKMGPEEVRKKLVMGVFASYKVPFIEEWLLKNEEKQNATTLMYHEMKAPSGKIFSASKVPALERDGWVDAPAKFKKKDAFRLRNLIKTLKGYLAKIWKDPVWSKVIAVAILALLGFIWTSLNSNKPENHKPIQDSALKGGLEKPKKGKSSINHDFQSVIIKRQELKHVKKVPILDENLYVGWYYSSFMFGGVNLKGLKIAARSEEAEPLKLLRIKYNNPVRLQYEDIIITIDSINDRPYIEFEYKGEFFAVLIDVEIKSSEDFSYYFSLKRIKEPSMFLNDYKDIPTDN